MFSVLLCTPAVLIVEHNISPLEAVGGDGREGGG